MRNVPRVVIAAPSGRPAFRRVSRCVRSFSESRVCAPTFTRESERGPFVRDVEKCDEKRLGIKFMAAALPDFSLLLVLRVNREPGNVCI